MCRDITGLRGLDPPATDEEIEAAARQFIRKVSGLRQPSPTANDAFEASVFDVTAAVHRLLGALAARRQPPTTIPPLRRPDSRRSGHFGIGEGALACCLSVTWYEPWVSVARQRFAARVVGLCSGHCVQMCLPAVRPRGTALVGEPKSGPEEAVSGPSARPVPAAA
jgi:hypothetical protein